MVNYISVPRWSFVFTSDITDWTVLILWRRPPTAPTNIASAGECDGELARRNRPTTCAGGYMDMKRPSTFHVLLPWSQQQCHGCDRHRPRAQQSTRPVARLHPALPSHEKLARPPPPPPTTSPILQNDTLGLLLAFTGGRLRLLRFSDLSYQLVESVLHADPRLRRRLHERTPERSSKLL